MSGKTKRATVRSGSAKPASSTPIGIVVRRGALRRFDKLARVTATLPVALSWDRRTSKRPSSSTPATERRQAPPFTWEAADFVVVADAPPSASHPSKRAITRNAGGSTTLTAARKRIRKTG
jgi:hypothetical protein